MSDISGIAYVLDGGWMTLQISTSFTANTNDNTISFFDSTNTLLDQVTGAPVVGIAVGFINDWVGTGDYHILIEQTGSPDSTATLHYDAGSDTISSVVIGTGVTSMAGTGQGRLFSARCRMQEPNGRKFTLEGNGLDAAGAIGELEAKLALVDARVTVISAVRLTGNLSSGQITAFNTVDAARSTDTGGYDDVDITLRQVFNAGTSTQVIETPVIRIQDAVNGIASSSIDGTVDVTNALVAALATAYVDSDGNTGYAAYHGRFTRS